MILGEQGTEAHSRSLNYLRLKEELPFSLELVTLDERSTRPSSLYHGQRI